MSHLQVDQINIYYEEHGTGPALLLLHGLTANLHAFDGLLEAGLDQTFRCIRLDFRGRGLSSAPEHGYSIADHAGDVVGLLDVLGIDSVLVVGHSFGGLVGLNLAAHHGQRIRGLVLLDSAISLAHPDTKKALQAALSRLERVYPSWSNYLAEMQQAPFLAGRWHPLLEAYYRADIREHADGTVQPRSSSQAIAEVMDGVIASPWSDWLAQIRQPVVLLYANESYGPPGSPPLLSPAAVQATLDRLPHARSRSVAGNHITMLYGSGATQIVAAITAFQEELCTLETGSVDVNG